MNTVNERWVDVIGYEGVYLISDHGRVMSLYRERGNGNGGYFQQTRILKTSKTSTGYLKVDLKKDGIRKNFKIHQLVARHFIANPYNYKIINHLDGNPLNNYYKNLEWCDYSRNQIHALENGLRGSFDIDKQTLEYLYITKKLSGHEIADMLGVSGQVIYNKIKEYGIVKTDKSEYGINEEWLVCQFEIGRSNKEIAEEIGCDPSLISKYKHRIKNGGKIYA